MSIFATLTKVKDAVIQKRTIYTALYQGVEIYGCNECGNNKEFPGLIPRIPTHKCMITCTSDEDLMTIYDPYNIPEDCPLKMVKE